MKKIIKKICFFSALVLCTLFSHTFASPLNKEEVPKPLEPWVEWVLFDQEKESCSYAYNDEELTFCAWPSQLNITLEDTKGSFTQTWEVQAETWVRLPGNNKQWPLEVTVNDKDAIVVSHHGSPSIKLAKGNYQIKGTFLWANLPDSLSIPPTTGLIKISRNGVPISFPHINQQGQLWLANTEKEKGAQGTSNIQDSLDVQVYRKIDDDHPMQVRTRLIIHVSGRSREIVFPKLQLTGFTPLNLKSKLPARINRNGDLHMQLRSGQWQVDLISYRTGVVSELTAPDMGKGMPTQEVWVFRSNPTLRLTEISGVAAIDSRQTRLPKEWQSLPAYLLKANETMMLKTLQRGNESPEPNRLTLNRVMWMDFEGKAYTTHDYIKGTMSRDWRLVSKPELQLGSVTMDTKPQFITTLEDGTNTGIEVRRGHINLEAVSRYSGSFDELPVNGWQQDLQSVRTTLYLAPGWKLFSAHGADNLPNTWLQSWTLLDLFLVLIIAVSIVRLWSWQWGLFGLLTMVLIWHESDAPKYIWLNLMIAIALLRVLPKGFAKTVIGSYRNLSLLALLLMVIPFSVTQVRNGLYPQLGLHSNYDAPVNSFPQDKYVSSSFSEESDVMQAPAEMYSKRKVRKKLRPKLNSSSGLEKSMVQNSVTQEVDSSANIQTGPGLPTWKWKSVTFEWDSPVNQNQTLKLNLISPMTNAVLNFLRVILLLVLIWRLLSTMSIREDKGDDDGKGDKGLLTSIMSAFKRKKPLKDQQAVIQNRVLVSVFLAFSLLLVVPVAAEKVIGNDENVQKEPPIKALVTRKQEVKNTLGFPSQQLLHTLQQRLLVKSDCLPECAQIEAMRLDLSEQGMTINLKIHSAANVAIPLPGNADQWKPDQILINNKVAKNLYQDNNGVLWLGVSQGVHRVVLQGALPKQPQVQLSLPLLPKHVKWQGVGWAVEGIRDNNIPSQQLQLVHLKSKQSKQLVTKQKDLSGNNYLPPLVHVERTLRFGLDWFVETQVTRLSPKGTPLSMKIPLLQGESVLSNTYPVKDNKILINLTSAQQQIRWRSQLPVTPNFELKAVEKVGIIESWKLDISPIWHVDISGIPEIHHAKQSEVWLPEWKPWPGEVVKLAISRPKGIAGKTLTIDRSILKTEVGKRLRETTLILKIRSSRGGQHPIKLPENAELISVKIKGDLQPVKQRNRIVRLPIVPGKQQIELKWRTTAEISSKLMMLPVDVGVENVNNSMHLLLGRDRWILFTKGPTMGPAVLFWGVLLVILIGSIILGRIKISPLKSWQWFLLGAGLSLASPIMIIIVVGWLLALSYRPKLQHVESRFVFNTVQVLLVLLTVGALGSLFLALQQGLLGYPDMQVTGNNSYARELHWYLDRSSAELPQPWVLSVPLLVYRILMLLWALWLAFSLISWLRMGWESFSTGGLWRKWVIKMPKKKKPESVDDNVK